MGINFVKYFFLTAVLLLNQSADEHSDFMSAGNSTDSWPQFRGPDGQGNAPNAKLALTWSEEEHVSWKFTDPGEGWSSPVVDDGRIWITTACDSGHSLRAVCLDLKSGKLMNEVEVFHVDTLHPQNSMNSYASPSPLIANGKLYVHFGTYGTACLASGTGKILWKRSDLKLNHEVGPGSSPAIWHDKLIIPSDGKDVQYVIALSTSTGETAWKTERSFGGQSKPYPCWAYCTPLIVNIDSQDQAIIPGAAYVCAYDPADGKELWSVNYHGWSNVPRPLYAHGLVYVCTGFGKPLLMAIHPERRGNGWSAQVAWKIGDNVPTIPSPVLIGDRLYMISDNGTGSCVDALTGRQIWVKRLGGSFAASILNTGQFLYCFDQAGVTTVLGTGDEFKVLAKNRLNSGCMASAGVAGNALILRTKKYIYRIEN
jgi:outer membrane protein assembly factor BamB